MGDEGVRRELWDGKVPVCFKLDDDDTVMPIRGDRVAPEPCYVCLSPIVVSQARLWLARLLNT